MTDALCPVLPGELQAANGSKVTQQAALSGKIVALFFSAEWCGACTAFVPTLRTLYEDSKENDSALEVIYVSSDNDAAQMQNYMRKKHGSWLSVPFEDKGTRDALKKKYGCFAGRESSSFPGVKRRAGVPSIVIISPSGEELVHMDCDPPREINRKGDAILDDWVKHKWP